MKEKLFKSLLLRYLGFQQNLPANLQLSVQTNPVTNVETALKEEVKEEGGAKSSSPVKGEVEEEGEEVEEPEATGGQQEQPGTRFNLSRIVQSLPQSRKESGKAVAQGLRSNPDIQLTQSSVKLRGKETGFSPKKYIEMLSRNTTK